MTGPGQPAADAAMALWRESVDSLSEGFVLFDSRQRLVVCNATYRAAYPLIADLLFPGASFADILRAAAERGRFVPAGRVDGWVDERLHRHLKAEGPVECRLGNGRWYRISEASTPSGGVVKLLADITERREAEKSLRESEERYRRLVHLMPDAVVLLRADGISFANAAARDLLGVGEGRLEGRDLAAFMAPVHREAVAQALAAGLAGTAMPFAEFRLDSDGQERWAEIGAAPMATLEGAMLQVVLRDVSARKEMEEKIRRAQKFEALGLLAGGVAHEFNNLMTAVGGFATMGLRHLDDIERVRLCLSEIAKASDRAVAVTRQLLTYSRRQPQEMRSLYVDRLIRETEGLLRPLLGEQIALSLDVAHPFLPVRLDGGQFTQALMNLAVNGRDAMPDGGSLVIGARRLAPGQGPADLWERPGEGWVEVWVSDTGSGIDAKTRQRMFDPFFTTKPAGKGTGLGLSTVWGVVESSGGRLEVDTAPQCGSVFRLYFPLTGETPGETIAGLRSGAGAQGGTVLLVEDEAMVRDFARLTLVDAGFEVLSAENGAEALTLARQHTGEIDVLLSDIGMPGMDGFSLADSFAEERPRARIILMSGYTEDRNRAGRDATIDLFLPKPVNADQLTAAVRSMVAEGRGFAASSGVGSGPAC